MPVNMRNCGASVFLWVFTRAYLSMPVAIFSGWHIFCPLSDTRSHTLIGELWLRKFP
jgi:hypothetical protein